MKTEFNILIIMTVLVSATLFLIHQNPDEIPQSMAFQKYSNEIIQIDEKSKEYQLINDVQNFNESINKAPSIQKTIAKNIVQELNIKLSASEQASH